MLVETFCDEIFIIKSFWLPEDSLQQVEDD